MFIRRLVPGDEALALKVFALMAAIFEEEDNEPGADAPLDLAYARDLLARVDFFGFAASDGNALLGGITAHVLPMTRSRSSELFIYDLAVSAERRRRGVARALVNALLAAAQAEGIRTGFVPADNEDSEAIAFYRALGAEAAAVTHFTFTR